MNCYAFAHLEGEKKGVDSTETLLGSISLLARHTWYIHGVESTSTGFALI